MDYDTVILNTPESDNEQIIKALDSIYLNRDQLTVQNYYKEVPVFYKGEVVYIEKGIVEILVHENLIPVLLEQKKIFLSSNHFPMVVVGDVKSVRVKDRTAFICNFQYIDPVREQRKNVRVAVDNLPITLIYEEMLVQGEVIDISLMSAAINFPSPLLFGREADVNLRLELDSQDCLNTTGKILRIMKLPDGQFRHIVLFNQNNKDEEILSRFVFQRQVAIVRTMKEMAAETLN